MGIITKFIKFVFAIIAIIVLSSFILVSIISVTFALSQMYPQKDLPGQLRIINPIIPRVSNSKTFSIDYELSQNIILANNKSIKTFITGSDVYTKDNEITFDGKKIDWIVHAKKTGLISFNITLYDGNKLLDIKQFTVYVPDLGAYIQEHEIKD